MKTVRSVKTALRSKSTMEGAGVRLKRVFGYNEVPLFDPFLLLDHFGSSDPSDYMAGFPWHPHRGIETITYMLRGSVKHEDSLGNGGVISSCDVQWMTAGSGIFHQEMPQRTDGLLQGFQLWANLPSTHKMMAPRYRDITDEQFAVVDLEEGGSVRILSGEFNGTKGPVQDIVTRPEYLDIRLEPGAVIRHGVQKEHTIFAYVYEGNALFSEAKEEYGEETVVLFDEGDEVLIEAENDGTRFLLVSGRPIGEPVAWRGPIVMNTDEELKTAFSELRSGNFIKNEPGTV